MRRPPEDGVLHALADRSEGLTGIPILRRLGWLGLIIYLLVMTLITLLLWVFFVLEWTAVAVVSITALVLKVVARKPFPVRAKLVGYIGAHKPQDGRVWVGPPDRPTYRPVLVEWRRATVTAARSGRRDMATSIEAGQFADVNG